MGKLNEKVALVTGSTSGIGRAIAIKFAAEGAKVVVTGRRSSNGETVVKEIQENGGEAIFLKLDLLAPGYADVVEQTIAAYGKLDILVLNAGVASADRVDGILNEDAWDTIMTTNLKAPRFLLEKALPYLEQTKGNIVCTGATSGISARGAGTNTTYGPGKAALFQPMQMIALHYGPKGIRMNMVSPGVTQTDILKNASEKVMQYLRSTIPMQDVCQPEDIANATLFLASEDARFITAQNLVVDGGSSIR